VVLALEAAEAGRARLAGWYREERRLVAPAHWLSEATSALRRLRSVGRIEAGEVDRAVQDLFLLDVEAVVPGRELCLAALRWAETLTHSKAYDAFYVALAEQEEAELWTADRRLARRATQVGAPWVRSLLDDGGTDDAEP
jgi:predicted nucleic acid-binding protein